MVNVSSSSSLPKSNSRAAGAVSGSATAGSRTTSAMVANADLSAARTCSGTWRKTRKFLRSCQNVIMPLWSKIPRINKMIRKGETAPPKIMSIIREKRVNVNKRDGHGRTPLAMACRVQNKPLVRMLMDIDANPYVRDKDGFDSIAAAAELDDPSILNIILEDMSDDQLETLKMKDAKSNINLKRAAMTAAVEAGNISLLRCLKVLRPAWFSVAPLSDDCPGDVLTEARTSDLLRLAAGDSQATRDSIIDAVDALLDAFNAKMLKHHSTTAGCGDLVVVSPGPAAVVPPSYDIYGRQYLAVTGLEDNNTLLMGLCLRGDYELVKTVLKMIPLDVTSRSLSGVTAFDIAVNMKHTRLLATLIIHLRAPEKLTAATVAGILHVKDDQGMTVADRMEKLSTQHYSHGVCFSPKGSVKEEALRRLENLRQTTIMTNNPREIVTGRH